MKRRKEAQQQTAALSVLIRISFTGGIYVVHSYCRKPVIGFTGDEHYRSLPAYGAILGCLIAEREGKLCGIITDRDIALRVTGAKCDPDKTKVHD